MSGSRDTYVHGTDPTEQKRLSLLNRLINERCLGALGLRPGESILDIGSGLGQMTRVMARATGVQVIGIERSAEQIAEARRQAEEDGEAKLVAFRPGDANDPPLSADEWGSFDTAHARYVLEHVADPLAVVRVMVRAVKPGGRILLIDDDHDLLRLCPEPPGFTAIWNAYIRTYDHFGNDPFVGRHLVDLIHRAGAKPVRCESISWSSCAGMESFRGIVENLIGCVAGARESILAAGAVDAPAFDRAIDAIRHWGERPDAVFWYVLNFAEGRAPLSS